MKVVARPSVDELVASLDRAHERLCSASAAMLETIAYLDEHEHWGDDQASLSCVLAGRYGVSAGTAWEWVRVARAVRRLPAISDAYAGGALSWDQLRAVTRFATTDTDQRLAHEAPGLRVAQLWAEARRHERRRKERLTARQCRGLHMEWDESKTNLHVEADLPGERGAAFESAVTRRAEQVEVEKDVVDPKQARLLDALVELVSSSSGGPQQATLVIHADAAVVLGDEAEQDTPSTERPPLAETHTGVQLHDEAVRRLACDARVEWVLERHGRAVGIGRRGPGTGPRARAPALVAASV